jgi:hypothetical protein
VLRQELGALSPGHLRTIVDAYRLDVDAASRDVDSPTLVREIVGAVRARFAQLDSGTDARTERPDAPRA